MNNLPFLINTNDAIMYYTSRTDCTGAEKSYIVAMLSREGFTNKAIRKALKIKKVYTVTHLKRVGTSLTEKELTLWHRNPDKITLGHVRAIAKLPQPKREEMLRGLLTKRTSVQKFELIAQGKSCERNTDIQLYERLMGEVLGRQIKIRYNPSKRSGTITLDFFTLEDLDNISLALGYNSEENL